MTPYDFKLLPEALRAAGYALLVFVLMALAAFNVSVFSDWVPWVLSLAAGGIAVAAAAALGVITRNRV